ncbi:MAG: hypothetical protein J2P36_32750, partial [Ktedonobacteraceae bacterium]|nr:hypothetical protein [Ktedonobacteraceae bacterium]
METKRCPRCHKLHRASTKVCSRCGVPLVRKYTTLDTDEQTRPTLPPASPHRAGHYSGLHPEDQPYQSTKIAVRRASLTDRRRDGLPRPEPEHIQLPDPLHEAETEQQVTYPARQRVQSDPLSGWQPPSGLRLPRRIVPILLALSCLFFLLASGVLTLVLIGKNASIARAAVIASPGSGLRAHDFFTLSGHGFGARSLVTFTYDDNKKIFNAQGQPLLAHTDNNGSFSVRIQVPDTWEPGTH